MRVSLAWLAEWIPLPPSEALLERLVSAGLEIKSLERTGPELSALRVGHVVAREKHPDADRLSVCRVDVGAGEPLEIVCGAPNVAAGQRVAVALVGSELPGGVRIKRSKIRGVTSNGMICSAKELGLGDDPAGILVLAPDAPVGCSLSEVIRAGDTVLDLEITPNRGDWASLLGIAREVRALFGGSLSLPPASPAESGRAAAADVRVEIEDRAGCHRYAARVVRGVSVSPSPAWLVARLEAAGQRSVNNVVDVTNLVMLELGQPLHAFDLDRLRGGVLRVRAPRPGERLRTLDGQERALEPQDLVIADAAGAVALAGVMGGAESEVHEGTKRLLLESAHFHPSRVRKTARRLGLHSEASYRFERSVDPDGQARALDRAAQLLAELAGGAAAPGVVEATGEPAPRTTEIRLSPERVNRLLGTELTAREIAALLARVDVACEEVAGELRCRPPRYRADLAIPADLIEETARLHGYDAIPSTLPAAIPGGISLPPRRASLDALRESLVGSGLTELMTFVCVDPGELDALRLPADDPRRRCVRVENPVHASQPTLRSQLVGSILRCTRNNLARQQAGLRLFEVSRVFTARGAGELPAEPLQAACVLTPPAGSLWEASPPPVFFQVKGIAERLLADLGVEATFQAGEVEPFLHPGASGAFLSGAPGAFLSGAPGAFLSGAARVAVVGELHPACAAAFEIEAQAALLVVDVDALDARRGPPPRYREVSRHPNVVRDLAVLLGRDVPAGQVIEAIKKRAGDALVSVTVFDRYEGKGIPEGRVSLAFRLVFQRVDRTLTEPEVARATERVVALLAQEFGGELR